MNSSTSCGSSQNRLLSILHNRPQAAAHIAGSESHSDLSGKVRFYQIRAGVIVWAEINGLPRSEDPCHEQVFGFHIHEGSACGGNMDDPFADAMSHYDPSGCEHPNHAGDCRHCSEATVLRSPCF